MFSSSYWQDFDEIWRFEECSELLENVKLGSVVFFNRDQSNALWTMLISKKIRHLMHNTIYNNIFTNVEKYELSFDNKGSANVLFERFLERAGVPDILFLFFSINSACVLRFSLLREFWNEIFLPSDETTIAIDINSKTVLYSFEECFFIGTKPA